MLEQIRVLCIEYSIRRAKNIKAYGDYDVFQAIFYPILFSKRRIILTFWKHINLENWIRPTDLAKLKSYPVPEFERGGMKMEDFKSNIETSINGEGSSRNKTELD